MLDSLFKYGIGIKLDIYIRECMNAWICGLLFVATQSVAFGEQIVFSKDVNGEYSELHWNVEQQEDKLVIQGESRDSTTLIHCSKEYHFENYVNSSKDETEKFTYKKDRDQLIVSSNRNGKIKEKSYDLKHTAWVQDFGFGLKPFLASSHDEFFFYIINPKDLKLNKMVATKEKIEPQKFGDKEYLTQKVKITLDGFYSRFWKAELWFDTKTNQLLRYKANEGPSTPTTIITFKE